MLIFTNDKHENILLLSDLYGAECSIIDSMCLCKEEKRQLHGILYIMRRSMCKAKQADVPAIYPLKGEHKKPDHVKPEEVKGKTGDEQDHHEQIDPSEMPVMEEFTEVPKVHEHKLTLGQGEAIIYQTLVMDEQVRRPNPLLEPSSYPQVMSKQLPKY